MNVMHKTNKMKDLESYVFEEETKELDRIRTRDNSNADIRELKDEMEEVVAWSKSLMNIGKFIRDHTIDTDPNRVLLICLWTAHCINYQDSKETHERDFGIVRQMLTDAGYANDEWHNSSRMLDALDKFFVGYKHR